MKKKCDWLLVLPQDGFGGSEKLMMDLITYLSNKGEHCIVIFLRKKTFGLWEHLEGVCDIKYARYNSIFLGYVLLLPRLISLKTSYIIKRTFSSQTLINAMMGLLKKLGVLKTTKVIVRESNSIFHLLKGLKLKRYTIAYWLGYHGVDLIICQTKFMKKQLVDAIPWIGKKLKMIVLSNPINLGMIEEKAKVQISGLDNEEFLAAAGRLVPIKGFDILIDSFATLSKEFPKLKLKILGDGPEKENLQEQIIHLGLEEKIQLVGFVDNVFPYFKNAKLCVMSSRVEGFPNVLLQMMSQNNKVVTTLSAGDIENLKGVFTCGVEDEDGLTNTIKECLSANTSNNRELFDKNLEQRTIAKFIENLKSGKTSTVI